MGSLDTNDNPAGYITTRSCTRSGERATREGISSNDQTRYHGQTTFLEGLEYGSINDEAALVVPADGNEPNQVIVQQTGDEGRPAIPGFYAVGSTASQSANASEHAPQPPVQDGPSANSSNVHRNGPVASFPHYKTSKSHDFITPRLRRRIILDLIKKVGGAFPGIDELFLAYKCEARKLSPHVPYQASVVGSIGKMVDAGQLKKGSFLLETSALKLVAKDVICLPHLSLSGPEVRACEEGIAAQYPTRYIPQGIDIDPEDCQFLDIELPTNNRLSSVVPGPKQVTSRVVEHCDAHVDSGSEPRQQGLIKSVPSHRRPSGAVREQTLPPRKRQRRETSTPAYPSFQWEMHPLSQRAADQEKSRETQAVANQIIGEDAQLASRTTPSLNSSAWIASMTCEGAPIGGRRTGFKFCTTFTDPIQRFSQKSWTFSTDFMSYRMVRPKLFIDTQMQRKFEDSIPASTEEIVQQRDIFTTLVDLGFERTVDAVQEWEVANEAKLSSQKSLMLPRFINFCYPEHAPLDYGQIIASNPPASNSQSSDAAKQGEMRQKTCTKRPADEIAERAIRSGSGGGFVPTKSTKGKAVKDGGVTKKPRAPRKPKAKPVESLRPLKELENANMQHHLLVAVSISRLIVGGNKKLLGWAAIGRMMPNFDGQNLKYRYYQIKSSRPALIDQYESAVEEVLLNAFLHGQLPTPNYDDINNWIWPAACKWVATQTIGIREHTSLPLSLQTLENDFIIKEDATQSVSSDVMFNPRSTAGDRLDVVQALKTAIGLDIPCTPSVPPCIPEDTWPLVRANVFTPVEMYDPEAAKAALEDHTPEQLAAATSHLKANGIITNAPTSSAAVPSTSPTDNRKFVPDPSVQAILNKFWAPKVLHDAVNLKRKLDNAFGPDLDGTLSMPANLGPAAMIVYNALVLDGEVDVRADLATSTTDPLAPLNEPETKKRRLSSWGLTQGDYRVTKVAQARTSMPLHVRPTALYELGSGLSMPLPPIPNISCNRIPIWRSFQDKEVPGTFGALVAAVLNIVVTRPHATVAELTSAFQGKFAEWELRMVVTWCVEAGVIVEKGGRLGAARGWWRVLGGGEE